MSAQPLPTLCGINGCRLLVNHRGMHNSYPTSAWEFMEAKDKNKLNKAGFATPRGGDKGAYQNKDKNKLNKAGFATPRGGDKGAYQNHVTRSNRVIVPFEKLATVNLNNYTDGYIIRLFPEQYFEATGRPKAELITNDAIRNMVGRIEVGRNAFVNYRFHNQLQQFPPMPDWNLRSLEKGGKLVSSRGRDVVDVGHYTNVSPSMDNFLKIMQEPYRVSLRRSTLPQKLTTCQNVSLHGSYYILKQAPM